MKWGVKTKWFDKTSVWLYKGDSKFQMEPFLFDTKHQAENFAKNLDEVWVELYTEHETGEPK